MDPDFQRDFIWSEDKQSKLIESVLMRMPLPVFYLAEHHAGKIVVVDGLQRLSTFKNFLSNNLALELPGRPELHGKKFDDLSSELQNRIEDFNLVVYILDEKVPDQARLDMFDRVNSGVALSHQQMRNCLYMGQATQFLKGEANTEIFSQATGNSFAPGTQMRADMRDREFVNRFCAFHLISIDDYDADMDAFLARALKTMNTFSPEKMSDMSRKFRTSLANNFNVFGKHAFRKHSSSDAHRAPLNASIWDVMTVGLARYSDEEVTRNAQSVRTGFYELMKKAEFQQSVTAGTNTVTRVKCRFALAEKMLSEALK